MLKLLLVHLEHEILRESLSVTPNSLLERLRRHTVPISKIAIQHHLVAAHRLDPANHHFIADDQAWLRALAHGSGKRSQSVLQAVRLMVQGPLRETLHRQDAGQGLKV